MLHAYGVADAETWTRPIPQRGAVERHHRRDTESEGRRWNRGGVAAKRCPLERRDGRRSAAGTRSSVNCAPMVRRAAARHRSNWAACAAFRAGPLEW